jgi:DNA-directed RNA polymerase subunit RPC12/RpoP
MSYKCICGKNFRRNLDLQEIMFNSPSSEAYITCDCSNQISILNDEIFHYLLMFVEDNIYLEYQATKL